MKAQSHAGSCLCGKIRFSFNSAPMTTCICHCSICRRSVGSAGVAWASFPRESLQLEGEVSWHQSSDHARRGFCGGCGTSLFFKDDRHRSEIEVTTATLTDADKLAPRYHSWAPNRLAWENINDGLPRYREDGGSLPMEAGKP